MDGVERSIHYQVVSVVMPGKMGLKSKASVLSFLLFLTTFLLFCQFANYVSAASSPSILKPSHMHPHSKQLSKRPNSFVSSLRQREWRTLSALNSSRNARQVPEIPALYSAPKVLSPETPALYSAPGEINSDVDTNEQNDVDADPQARQATTEITIGGEEDDEVEDEASSEDYQYGVPTEKYGMSDDSNQAEEESLNEYPTDSPMPQATYLPPVSRTNDVDFSDDDGNAEETTEDSYSGGGGGYNNDPANNEPSQQYGPPAPQTTNRKNGNGKGSNKRKMQSPTRRTNNSNKNNGRPSDQQQKMGNRMQQQPQNQKNHGYDSEPQSAYLPPVYQPPSQPIDHQNDYQQEDAKDEPQHHEESQSQEDHYTPSTYGQQPPNVNYHTLPDIDEDAPQPNEFGGSSYEPSSVDKGANGDNIHSVAQGFSEEERSKGLPDNGQQGQYFGNEQPNSVYGPPGVNHLQSHSNNRDEGAQEEELEGLNENIVDAELLERVQQIIEDHERQQKAFLDRVQKDNEKTFGGGGGGSSGYSGASGSSSFSNENELHDGFSSRGGGGSTPYTAYGPPALSNGPSGSGSNGYHNPNSVQQQQQPKQSNGDRDHRSQSGNNQNKPSGSYSPSSSSSSQSQNGGGYNNQGQGQKLEFQVQKAVLSRHFTETEISPGYPEIKEDGYQNENKLSNFAGPEYLPPVPPSQPRQQQQSGNSGYPNSYNSGNGKPEDRPNVFNVKVSAGIGISGKPKSTSGSSANQQPSNSYGSPPPPPPPYSTLPNTPLSSLTSGATRSQNSQGYNARPAGASTFSTGSFPSELPSSSYQTSYPQQQPQQQNFQPSTFWSRTHPQHDSPQQTRYGPPPPPVENRNEKPTTSYQPNTGSNSNINSNGDHSLGSGNPSNGDYHQRSYNSQQSQSQQQHSAFQPGGFNINNGNNGNSEPRPVYGIPLAPVITLDSDNNLSNFNGNSNNVGGGGGGSKEKNIFSSYSQDGNVGQSFPSVNTITSGSGSANNYYLPPSTPGLGSPSQNGEIGQHQFPSPSAQFFPQQGSGSGSANGDAPSYGLFDNPSVSSSSTYLMIQGHDGNSNNHIYNINHNGYDSSSSSFARLMSSHSSGSGAGDDGSSIIIPGGISNTFSLPIYDYSPSHQNHHDELVGAAAGEKPVVLPFGQKTPRSVTSPGSTFSNASSYGQKTQGNLRVSRRALTRKANVSPVNDNSNQKPLTSLASNSNSRNGKQ